MIQIKGQRCKAVYGDAYLMSMQAYPCIRAAMPAADLKEAIASYLPGVETFQTIVDRNTWDVFITTPGVTQATSSPLSRRPLRL